MPYGFSSPFPDFYGAGYPGGTPLTYGAQAMPDFRYRESAYAGNSALTPPGGLRTGNPLVDLVSTVGLQSVFPGQEFRPFARPEGGDLDYLRARGRFNDSFRHYREEAATRGILPPESALGQNPLVQQLTEGLKYGGSTYAAFQGAYGRFGSTLAGTPRMQGRRVTELVEGIDDAFSSVSPDGTRAYDYNKSFGFNRQESVENLDSAVRFGYRDLSRGELRDATRRGQAGVLAGRANELTRLGQGTFGADQSADQVNALLDKAMGGLAGVTTEKATEFLSRVQSVSRALDVNAKAFAEYLGAQQNVLKSMGVGGPVAANVILQNSLAARGLSERGRQAGDASLGDQNQAQAALVANAAASQGSDFMRQLRFVGAQATRMTGEEDRRYGVDGQGLRANLAAVNALKAAGRGAEAEALFGRVRNRFGADRVAEGGANLSDEDAARSQEIITDSSGADLDQEVRRRALSLAYRRASGEAGFDAGAVSERTYTEAVRNLGAMDLGDRDQVAAALRAAGVGEEAINQTAGSLAIDADVAISRTANYRSLGRDTQAQVRASLDQSTPAAQADNVRAAERAQREGNRTRNLNRVVGNSLRGFNVPEAIGQFITNAITEASKGGDLDLDRILKFGKEFGSEVMGADDLKKIQADLESGAMDVDPSKYQIPDLPGARGQRPTNVVSPDLKVQAGLNRLNETGRLGEYKRVFDEGYHKELDRTHDETKARAEGEKEANAFAVKTGDETETANKELGVTSKEQLEEQKKAREALEQIVKLLSDSKVLAQIFVPAPSNSNLSR